MVKSKRFIAITLAFFMLVPCLSFATFAEIAIVNDTWISDRWDGLSSNTTLCPGDTVMAETYTNPILATWGTGYNTNTYNNISFNHIFSEAYNITEMKYLSLELYASDKTIFDKTFIIELTSSGTKDDKENNIRSSITKYVSDMGNNWYRIEIPISDIKSAVNGGLDKTACNYMRMYYDDSTTFEHSGSFTFGIKRLAFTAEKAYQRELDKLLDINVYQTATGWNNINSDTNLCVGETVYSKTYTKPIYTTWGYPAGTTKSDYEQITFNYHFTQSCDITQMKYLTLEVYATNKAIFDHRFVLELTSSGISDTQENNIAKALTEYVTDMGNNWYRIEIPISDIKTAVNGGLNKTACNYMRMYYDDGFGTAYTYSGSFTFGIRGMGFSDEKTSDMKDLAVMYGTAIRCTEPSGIRFKAKFDSSNTKLTGVGTDTANFGIILISEKKYAADPNMTFAEMAEAGIKVPASKVDESEAGIYGVYAVLTGITEDHFTDNVVAIPYIDNEFVSEAKTRNIYGIAKLVVADPEAEEVQKSFCSTQIIAKVEAN